MSGICALVRCHNDALRLGRALETLRSCDQTVVLDSGSTDATLAVAREYAARVIPVDGPEPLSPQALSRLLESAQCEWLLTLAPDESVSELLEAELYEWRIAEQGAAVYALTIREQQPDGEWRTLPREPRLIHRSLLEGGAATQPLELLEGPILRFSFPG